MAKSITIGNDILLRDKYKLTFDQNSKKVSGENTTNSTIIMLPTELDKIKKEEDFVTYCHLAYGRINQSNELSIHYDKPEGSITPRSEGITKFIDDKSQLVSNFKSDKIKDLEIEKTSTNVVQNKSRHLKEYLSKVDENIKSIYNGIVFEKTYQKLIRGKDLYLNSVINTTPSVPRFGMNPSSLSNLVAENLDSKTLHIIEQELFKFAFDYLKGKESAETTITKDAIQYPDNVALVDVLVRDNGKIKKNDNSDGPETHTIALWKKTDKMFLLIDPSKVEYSKDLSNAIKTLSGGELSVHAPAKNILYGTGGKLTGYTELTSTSIEKHKFRDCVDVAVKIGFELNELQIYENVLSLTEIENALNLQISNQKDVATYLQNVNHATPNRASLSSDVNLRHNNRLLLEIKK